MRSRLIRRSHPDGPGFSLGPGFLEAAPPELAALIAQIIALWSEVELQRSRILVSLLGGNAEVALDMYLALSSSAAQKGQIDAVVRAALSWEDRELFGRLMKAAKPLEDERSIYAHWLWGTTDRPDCLVCMSPKDRIKEMAKIDAKMRRRERITVAESGCRRQDLFSYQR